MFVDVMDNIAANAVNDRKTASNINGSVRRSFPVVPSQGVVPGSLCPPMEGPNHPLHGGQCQTVRVVVNRDEKGYGMKVSGDNPVYVQSVKQGGAAEKAGLHAGDKIIEVNSENVMSSTHTEVVSLIKSSSQVVLTVQQRTGGLRMGSPSLHNRPLATHTPAKITGPQPVDLEKLYQLQVEREQHFRLMIEKEERYLEALRSQIARCPDDKKFSELEKTERNLLKLQGMLQSHVKNQNEQSPPITYPVDNTDNPPPLPRTPPPNLLLPPKLKKLKIAANDNEVPPPLPQRTARQVDAQNNRQNAQINGKVTLQSFLCEEINSNVKGDPLLDARGRCHSLDRNVKPHAPNGGVMVDNVLYSDPSFSDPNLPPPLPPRVPITNVPNGGDPDAANSINKQMSYPLVATCATLVNNYTPNHTHHRTKSSPESLLILSPAEASRRFIASESMTDLRPEGYGNAATPPGTPPPPYPSPLPNRRQPYSNRSSANTDEGDTQYDESLGETSSPDISPLRGSGPSPGLLGKVLANSSPIHAANPQTTQQSIMSMEDDEISDQEISQLEDHGPFKSLSRLWEYTPHLAVFMNYVLLNSDPNSLLFYLLTDLYKEGNAKEMRKWAYEIHSSFLVPGAPLRLSNVDENIAHEIDDVLTREYDKEEILRKIFWKARIRAKEELTKQLSDFQQKRTAGLGTIYGPADATLMELTHDKVRENKTYEALFLEKLDHYLEEIDKENYDPRKYYTAAALATVVTRVFGVRSPGHALDRCPTFVNKKSRTKFIRYPRKSTVDVQGHQFVPQQYYTVIACNHCHQIIYGIGPQGYQCSVCLINLHRLCVKLYEDSCPGPINKKDRGIQKLMDKILPEHRDPRRKQSSHLVHLERERRMQEERDNSDCAEIGDTKPGHPVARTGSDRRPDAVREESSKTQDGQNHTQENDDDTTNVDTSKSLPATTTHKRRNTSNINRSESVKEQSEKRKQRRNISDPLHNNKSDTTDIDQQNLNYITHSGSSSTASLSSRSSNDSPSFVDVSPFQGVSHSAGSGWGSDEDIEPDPPDWQSSLTEEELSRLQPHEKKRQDVINELFHTERSHLRNLKVLDRIFYRPLQELKILKQDEMSLLFPNLNRLLETHSQFNVLMKNKRKESVIVGDIGDILIVMFDGSLGETFKEAAATFCERQLLALDVIKEKRRKDSKFDNVLNECEKNIHCRRLPLQGFIPSEMQRLSKYPLLLERLIDIVEKNVGVDPAYSPAELCKLQQAHDRSKEILNHANEAAKQAWGRARLEEIYKHLDTSVFDKTASEHSVPNEFKTLDFKNCKLLHEGTVQLKRQNKGLLHVHMVLLEEVVILLQREGDRYLLKFFQTGMAGQQPLAPIIKVSTLLVRTNAALKSSLFLVNTSTQNSQMYELLTRDSTERKTWFKHLSDAADAYNKREGKSKRSEPTPDPDEETLQELPVAAREQGERAEAVGGGVSEPQPAEVEQSVHGSPDVSRPNSDAMDEDRDKRLSQSDNESGTPVAATSTTGGGVTTKFTADDWPLIQPSEVQVEVPPVHTAEPVLTPIEQIKRKGDEVRQALEDKEKLVADLLSIPRDEYHHIADMAIEESRSKEPCIEREPSELVLASVYQVDQLLKAVNDALSISETDPVLAKGGKHPSCASNDHISKNQMPSVPVHRLQEIATTLSSQLTTLLSVIKQKDEERDRIRKELQRTREQLHEKLSIHSPHYQDYDETTTQLDSTQSGDLESIEESPTENEST